jgi:sigma-B regulation protein RsbU (phosphoserine phosphatase)
MLPQIYPAFPDHKEFDLFGTMDPAKEVGGDLFDYLLLDDDHLMIVVGDVSGKGVPAALFMVIAKTLLETHSVQRLSPAEIFTTTNNELCKGNETGLFVTCWLGIVTLSTGELRFVNAGHPYPVLYHKGEFTFVKTKPNFVLGGMEGLKYIEHTITLEKGDRLLVYTDGVTEATNASEELFGDDRLMEAMKGTEKLTAPETCKAVRKSIDAFAGDAEQFDDITMLQLILKE